MSKQYSVNERAEQVVGKRDLPDNAMIFDFPCELDYQCPVHKQEMDSNLEWSEYNGFIWCERCDRDYPSALCMPDIDRAISIYLDCIEQVKPLTEDKDNE